MTWVGNPSLAHKAVSPKVKRVRKEPEMSPGLQPRVALPGVQKKVQKESKHSPKLHVVDSFRIAGRTPFGLSGWGSLLGHTLSDSFGRVTPVPGRGPLRTWGAVTCLHTGTSCGLCLSFSLALCIEVSVCVD